jgi:asparagine synthase (glutamine-hydrolysing)
VGPSLYHDQMRQHVYGLQNYNLWHEDRTSSAQSVEARVPFLDHRLVEFLASIPPALHEELFWDKQIIRRAARRWLSPSLSARQKVAFVATRDGGSSIASFTSMLTAILPAFSEKYLDPPDSPISKDGMLKLLGDGMSGTRPMFEVLPVVGACVSMAIFERMCSTIHREFAVHPVEPPSVLQEYEQLPEVTS